MTRAKTKSTKKSVKASRSGPTSLDRIVQAIASRASMGEERPSRKMVMGLALMVNAKSFSTTILNIKKKKGLVDYNATSIWLTEKGETYVGSDALAIPQNNDAMQDKIRTEMVKGTRARQIFDILLDGGWHSKAEIADEMNLTNNKSFGTTVSTLSKIVEKQNGKMRLVDFAFPCGRPEA